MRCRLFKERYGTIAHESNRVSSRIVTSALEYNARTDPILLTILTALSIKRYRHLSRMLTTRSGMTNEWLKSQGLIDIRTMWMKAHGYA